MINRTKNRFGAKISFRLEYPFLASALFKIFITEFSQKWWENFDNFRKFWKFLASNNNSENSRNNSIKWPFSVKIIAADWYDHPFLTKMTVKWFWSKLLFWKKSNKSFIMIVRTLKIFSNDKQGTIKHQIRIRPTKNYCKHVFFQKFCIFWAP